MRGFAATYTIISHMFANTSGKLAFVLHFGQEAVIIFFLLSGFVIRYSYDRSANTSFKYFFLKRFFRVYIPLVVIIIINYGVLAFTIHTLFPIRWDMLAGNLLMLQDTSAVKPGVICDAMFWNQPLWSLSYEWWFYMLFFAVSKWKANSQGVIVGIMSLLATVGYLFCPFYAIRIIMYFCIWWTGGEMAKLYLQQKIINFKTLLLPLLSLLVNSGILYINIILHYQPASLGYSPFLELRHFSFALLAVSVAIWWNKSGWPGFNKIIGWFSFIAPISFGLYISHWFMVADAHYLDDLIPNYYIRLFFYLALCIVVSYIIERVIYPRISSLILKKLIK